MVKDPIQPLSAKQLNLMRGKLVMGFKPNHDIWKIIHYIDWLEMKLDELDYEDGLGTEGWRHTFDHPDAD